MADTPRMSALKQLSASLPVANQRVATQQRAARDLQLQQAVQQATPAGATTQAAQNTGTAMAAQAGAQQVANTQQGIQQQGQVAQLGQQAEAQGQQARVAGLQSGAREQQMTNEQKFASISEQAKREMFDSRKQFAQDEMGRKFGNERQLADYAALKAKDAQQWADYQQKTEHLYARKSQMLQTAQAKLAQQLEHENKLINQLQDQATKKGIGERERNQILQVTEQKLKQREALRVGQIELQKAMDKQAADAANRQAMWQGAGTIVGAVVGAVASGGNPAGAQAGASLGGSAGTLASSQAGR